MNLETISAESIAAYVCRLREKEPEIAVATINRDLATLRRALRLASDWGELVTKQPKICLLAGEVGRERVLNIQGRDGISQ
jgi:hypothetical protein